VSCLTYLSKAGFTKYRQFTGIFIGLVLCAGFAVYLVSFDYDRYCNQLLGMFLDLRTTQERDHKHALEKLGKDYTGMGSGEGLACLSHYSY